MLFKGGSNYIFLLLIIVVEFVAPPKKNDFNLSEEEKGTGGEG